MKNWRRAGNPLNVVLLIVMTFAVSRSNGQQTHPSQSGYAPVNGVQVYYEVYQPAGQPGSEGRPIVLLHGAFYTIAMNWAQLIPELSKTRKVIALELQGHGHAPFSERKLTNTNLARDVEGVMDYLNVDSADMVGYSMGGSIAYQFAIQSPKRLKRLVIISSTYKTAGWLPEVNNAFKGLKPEFLTNTPLKIGYDAVALDKTKWTKFLEQMIAFAQSPFDLGEANISKIAAPVLIIAGDNDGLDKIELMKTYHLLGGGISADLSPMPKSRLAIIPSQGHVSVMMQTATILGYLNEFLK